MRPLPRMCIVGFGRMGKLCARLFSPGFDVEIISRRNIQAEALERGARQSEDAAKSLANADYVFLAVPIEALDQWIPKINELTKPSRVVMDCCTVRQAANEKLSGVQRRRFGLPEIGGAESPVDGEPDPFIRDYLEAQGCRLYPIAPEEKPVSGIAHFIGMALDLNLTAEERIRLGRGGAGQCLVRLIEHLKTNSPSTYKEIQFLDRQMSARRKEIIAWLKALDEELDRGEFRFEPHPPDRWRE